MRPRSAMTVSQGPTYRTNILKNCKIPYRDRIPGSSLLIHHQHGTTLPVRPDETDDLLTRTRESDTTDINSVPPVRICDQRAFQSGAIITIPVKTAISEWRRKDKKYVFHDNTPKAAIPRH